MFGFGKKKFETIDAIFVAIETAIPLWGAQKESGGIMIEPTQIVLAMDAVIKREGHSVPNDIRNLIKTLVMAFLMEEKLINKLYIKSQQGELDITDADMDEIEVIFNRAIG